MEVVLNGQQVGSVIVDLCVCGVFEFVDLLVRVGNVGVFVYGFDLFLDVIDVVCVEDVWIEVWCGVQLEGKCFGQCVVQWYVLFFLVFFGDYQVRVFVV